MGRQVDKALNSKYLEGVMKGDSKSGEVRVELKYCEHCGGLWVRERDAGVVYCENCQPKVADLPIPKKKPSKIKLPVRRHTALEDYNVELDDDGEMNFEAAAGGVA
jgi:ribosomal protein L37AE/L43A